MLNSVWFVNKNCGVTVNAKQMMVYPNKEMGCQFVGDLSDSGEESGGDEEEEETHTSSKIVDSDEEDDD